MTSTRPRDWTRTLARPAAAALIVGFAGVGLYGALGRARPGPPPTAALSAGAQAIDTRLDINSADAAQLELLPGIGPALARRIVEDRTEHGPFADLAALDRVKGIGPKTVEKLRPHIRVQR